MRQALAALVVVAAFAQPVMAQEVTAEVRTWQGYVLNLTAPTFEVFYTIVVGDDAQGPAAQAPPGGVVGSMAGAGAGVAGGASVPIGAQGYGSIQSSVAGLGGLLPTGPDAMQGRRQQEVLTLSRGGIETRVPVAEVAALVFSRQQVVPSQLPSHVAPTHFRHAATAVLSDGSQLQADYVNLGTSILRGTSAQGIVDIPWTEIETVRFRR